MRAPSSAALRASAGEVAVTPVAAREAEQSEAGRQQPAVGEVVDGGDQLLVCQVAGDPEHHESARLRDPGQPPVTRVAQRVAAQAERGGLSGHAVPSLADEQLR